MISKLTSWHVPLLYLSVLLTTPLRAEDSAFVTFERGTCPIVLTAPHGGNKPIPNVELRRGEGVSQFTTVRDLRTDVFTERIATEIERCGYGKPFVVIARFSRKYIDGNRRASDAFESPAARPHYNAYHDAIENACQEIAKQWGHGLLLDIHGTSAEPGTIFRGTNDGQTVAHLVNRFGDTALRGNSSLFGQFAAAGYTVNPGVGSDAAESARHRGGYTVRRYGNREVRTIDAIQIELGSSLRAPAVIDGTAKDLASAIVKFATTYLPKN